VQCGVHTLQLTIRNGLCNGQFQNFRQKLSCRSR